MRPPASVASRAVVLGPRVALPSGLRTDAPLRFFHVEVPRGCAFGVRVQQSTKGPVLGATILELGSSGFVLEWNHRSALTFPDDVIKVGDVIVRANAARIPDDIEEVLRLQDEPRLLVVARYQGACLAGSAVSTEEHMLMEELRLCFPTDPSSSAPGPFNPVQYQ